MSLVISVKQIIGNLQQERNKKQCAELKTEMDSYIFYTVRIQKDSHTRKDQKFKREEEIVMLPYHAQP